MKVLSQPQPQGQEHEIQPQQEEEQKAQNLKNIDVKWLQAIRPRNLLQVKNHSAVHYHGHIYIFGGYDGTRNHDTLYTFSLATSELSLITTTGTLPKRRNGHTTTLVGSRLHVIGGWLGTGPLAAYDICVLDLETLEWSQPPFSGDCPGACNMHTADFYKDEIFIFRGGNGRDYLNDLHALNVQTYVWRKVEAAGKYPPERANHSSVLLANKLYVFGGWNGYKRLNDLHMIDLDTETWLSVEVKGELPSPRAGMSMTNIGDKLLLFGGSGPSSKFFNDIQIYDPITSEWTSPRELSNKPQLQRAGHTSTLAEGKLYIIGGSCGSEYLTEISVLDTCPPPEIVSDIQHGTRALIKGLAEHINCKDFSDVTFMVEGRPFHAHRIVLTAMSEHFRAMFKSGMKESREAVIPVPGVSYAMFGQLMNYFYTGSLKLECKNDRDEKVNYLKELLKVSDQLMIEDVKQQCEARLAELLTPANCLTLGEFADFYNATQLRAYIQWYYKVNMGGKPVKSVEQQK